MAKKANNIVSPSDEKSVTLTLHSNALHSN